MTHSELIDQLSEELDLTKKETKELIDSVKGEFTELLGEGKGFSIPDLGTFKTKVKEVRKVYSPHHKKYMLVPPKQVVDFSPSKGLKEELKNVKIEE